MNALWRRTRRSAVLALLTGALFVAVLVLYRTGAIRDVDRDLLQRLRAVHNGWLDLLGLIDDLLFRPTPTFAAAASAAVLLGRFGPRWSWTAPLAIILTVLVEVVVKGGWNQVLHLRPLIDGVSVFFGGHYSAGGSFPSGHVARALFLAAIALAFGPRVVSLPFVALALTTPLARMYTEVHRFSDVLGGATLGLWIGCLAIWGTALLAELEAHLHRRLRTGGGGSARRGHPYQDAVDGP